MAGAVAWVGIYCIGAYLFGEALMKLAAPVGIALGMVVVAIIVAVARFVARHEQELQSKPSERCLAHVRDDRLSTAARLSAPAPPPSLSLTSSS